jgi:hypothetical protein
MIMEVSTCTHWGYVGSNPIPTLGLRPRCAKIALASLGYRLLSAERKQALLQMERGFIIFINAIVYFLLM